MAKKGEVTYVVKVIDKGNGIYKVTEKLEKMDKAGKKAESSVRRLDKQFTKFLKGGMVATSVALIGRELYNQGSAAVKAAGQMERYNATLETMLGSKSAARDRLEEYMRIAKVTPFEMTEVVEAGNKLQALERYSEDTLVMLGDLAAASGKPLEQALNAYAKMASGQKGIAVDMFRDLLITTDDWAKATGKGVKASGEMVASADEMLKVLPEILKSKGFFGLMAKQSETTEGKIANFQDSIFSLRAAIGERLTPTVKSVLGVTSKWVNSLEEAVKIPVEQKIAREQMELNILVEKLIDVNGNEEKRAECIAELNSKYPSFLENMDAEKVTTGELVEALKKANSEYEKKIKLATYSAKIDKLRVEQEEIMSVIANRDVQKKYGEKKTALYEQWGRESGLGYSIGRNEAQLRRWAEKKGRTNELTKLAVYEEEGKKMYGGGALDSKLQNDLKKVEAELSVLEDVIKEDSVEEVINNKTTVGGGTTGGGSAGTGGGTAGGGSKGTTLGSGGGSGRGGGAVVNIGNLVGKIEIHTVNMKEGVAEIKRIVTQALVEATAEI